MVLAYKTLTFGIEGAPINDLSRNLLCNKFQLQDSLRFLCIMVITKIVVLFSFSLGSIPTDCASVEGLNCLALDKLSTCAAKFARSSRQNKVIITLVATGYGFAFLQLSLITCYLLLPYTIVSCPIVVSTIRGDYSNGKNAKIRLSNSSAQCTTY